MHSLRDSPERTNSRWAHHVFLMPLICPSESLLVSSVLPFLHCRVYSSVDHCHLLRQQVGDDSQRRPLLMPGARTTFLGVIGLIDEIELRL